MADIPRRQAGAVSSGLFARMLYIPNEGVGNETLPVGPGNAVMGGPHLVKIAFNLPAP